MRFASPAAYVPPADNKMVDRDRPRAGRYTTTESYEPSYRLADWACFNHNQTLLFSMPVSTFCCSVEFNYRCPALFGACAARIHHIVLLGQKRVGLKSVVHLDVVRQAFHYVGQRGQSLMLGSHAASNRVSECFVLPTLSFLPSHC